MTAKRRADAPPGRLPGVRITRDSEMLTRDGTVLMADVYEGRGRPRCPVLLVRTAYNKNNSPNHYNVERLVRAGYIVVIQDVRGRYRSEGEYSSYIGFVNGEAEDGYDAVEWAAGLPGSNGAVGGLGSSYDAWLIWKYAALRPPSLRAMFAYSEPARYTALEGPGTIRPGRRLHWAANSIAPDSRRRGGKPGSHTPEEAEREWHTTDRGKWLWFLPWKDMPRYVLEPFYDDFRIWLRDPRRDPWQLDRGHREIELPNMHITGWYDHCISCLEHFTGMVKNGKSEAARKDQKLIIGPWNHTDLGKRMVGKVDFGPQAELDIGGLALRWFDHHLKGIQNGVDSEPTVRFFVMGENRWKSASGWPLARHKQVSLFLGSDGKANNPLGDGRLSSKPSSSERWDAYAYDPRDPVMSLYGDEMYTEPTDQRPLAHREDILVYQTERLAEELEVTGSPQVAIHASSSAPDTDFFARLIDVQPDGEARDLTAGMVRARYRSSLERPLLLIPGEVTLFSISLGPVSNLFKKRHRIRVDITSSDFPNFDRNHNAGRDDNSDSTLVVANQRIYSGGRYPSRLILPISG